jgi:hypothetical protein
MSGMLRKSLASTNIIESAVSVAEELCRRVNDGGRGIIGSVGLDQRCCWPKASFVGSEVTRTSRHYSLANQGIRKGLAMKTRTA